MKQIYLISLALLSLTIACGPVPSAQNSKTSTGKVETKPVCTKTQARMLGALDAAAQKSLNGGHFAKLHCDGMPEAAKNDFRQSYSEGYFACKKDKRKCVKFVKHPHGRFPFPKQFYKGFSHPDHPSNHPFNRFQDEKPLPL